MARTGEAEAKAAQAQDTTEKNQSFNVAQGAVQNYNSGAKTLEGGGQIGANPYLNPQYLASVNRLQAGTLDAENNAAKTNLQALNRRTGGMNSTATAGGIKDLALQKMRLGTQLSSERTAGDYTRNLGWQQQLLQNRLAPAGVESPYFSTSTQGQNASLSDLKDFGLASYGPWMAAIQAAGAAGSAAIPGGGKH